MSAERFLTVAVCLWLIAWVVWFMRGVIELLQSNSSDDAMLGMFCFSCLAIGVSHFIRIVRQDTIASRVVVFFVGLFMAVSVHM